MGKMHVIGKYRPLFNELLGLSLPCTDIYQSDGLIKHIASHHPDCVQYFLSIPTVIAEPDIIGTDPTHPDSIELIKQFDEYLLVAITLNKKENYLYVSSMFDQTKDKVERRLKSGRYILIK